MALIYTDKNLVEQGYLSGASMDWQEEDDENSFSLSMGLDDYEKLSSGCYVFDENNPRFGGRVQKVRIQTASNGLIWEGKTFAGILSTKIIEPPTGQAYRTITGTLAEKINEVLTLTGLSDVFYTNALGGSSSSWQIDRYTDVLTAFRKLAAENELSIIVSFDAEHEGQKLKISFASSNLDVAGEEYDSDLYAFDIAQDMMPVNHLICLGSGQLQNRMVRHLYRLNNGEIVTNRPENWSVEEEVASIYENTNAESVSELVKEGRKRFQELLDNGTKLEITPPEGAVYRIGDKIAGIERNSGIYVEKQVKKIIYKSQDDVAPTITYETANTKKG